MAAEKNAIESTARVGKKKEAMTKASHASVKASKADVKAKKMPLAGFVPVQGKKAPAPAMGKIPIPAGMTITRGGLIVPTGTIRPIPASKLKKGVETAKAEIKEMIDEVAGILTTEYNILASIFSL